MQFSARSHSSATANDNLLDRLKRAARPLSVSMLVALTGCVASQKALVPMDEVVVNDVIKMSTVIDAVRCEVARGLNYIGDKIRENKQEESFRIYSGTMTFSGTIKVVDIGGASVAAVIPIGTSLLTPSAGYTSTQTAQQDVKRTFKIKIPVDDIQDGDKNALAMAKRIIRRKELKLWVAGSKLRDAVSSSDQTRADELRKIVAKLRKELLISRTNAGIIQRKISLLLGVPSKIDLNEDICPKNVESRGFISTAMESQYDDTISSKLESQLKLQNVSLDMTTSFTVSRKPEGKITLNAIFNNPNLTSIDPILNASINESNIYAINLNFPLKRDSEPAETRVVVDCKFNSESGLSICVEQPFNETDGDRFNTFWALGFVEGLEEFFEEPEELMLEGLVAPSGGPEVAPEPQTAPVILDSFSPAF